MFLEAVLCVKNGRELFGRTQAWNIIVWLLAQLFCSIVVVTGCVLWHRYYQVTLFVNILDIRSDKYFSVQNQGEKSRDSSPVKNPTSPSDDEGETILHHGLRRRLVHSDSEEN